jgi:hypothetical protein
MPFCPRCGDEFEAWVTTCPDCKTALVASKPAAKVKRKSVPRKLVTVAVYDFIAEAELNKAKLESEGIPAFIFDGTMMNVNFLFSTALGGIKLQVDESQAERAQEILESTKFVSQKPEDYSGPLCPTCGSSDVRYERYSKHQVFWGLLVAPHPFKANQWKCNQCGFVWKDQTKENTPD